MDSSILTLILLVPLAGAVLVALLPDRGKLPAWLTLITTLITFGLTLHLPAHFDVHQSGFQFAVNKPWIENPAIFYHVGVDGLSLWLVVLVGLLGPVGVLASWNAINRRQKVFYSLFLLQQTAMYGVFISLDLMLYYGFWELSLVPMAILIAMYGRKEGSRGGNQVLPLHLYSVGAPARRNSLLVRTDRHFQLSANCKSTSLPASYRQARSSGLHWHSCSPSQ